jgi:putative endonuclease
VSRGEEAEERARRHLQRQGLVLVERNYRCRGGEIDLVMRDGEQWVFVEVRYRGHRRFGGALASVDSHKQARLVTAALHYLQAHRIRGSARFDVVAIEGDDRLDWVRNAFEAG